MLVPTIGAWIEQSHKLSSTWIMGMDTVTFVEITVRAGIGQVMKASLAPKCLWHNVVDMERLCRDDLWCVAIFTAVAGTLRDSTSQQHGYVGHETITYQGLLD